MIGLRLLLARPLFSPDRRPTADAVTVASGRTVPGLPRLAGILVGPFGRSAIFATNGAKPIVVQEGGRVAAYTIKSIEATQVRLLGPDGAQVLYPSFEPAAAPARRPPPRLRYRDECAPAAAVGFAWRPGGLRARRAAGDTRVVGAARYAEPCASTHQRRRWRPSSFTTGRGLIRHARGRDPARLRDHE